MTIGRRFELLSAHAAHEIPRHRRQQLLEEISNLIDSDDCSAKGAEEIFYMLAAGTAIYLSAYAKKVQADMGTQILVREMGAKL